MRSYLVPLVVTGVSAVVTAARADASHLHCDVRETSADGASTLEDSFALPLRFESQDPYDDPDDAGGERAYFSRIFCRGCAPSVDERGRPYGGAGAVVDFVIRRDSPVGYLRIVAARSITPFAPHYLLSPTLGEAVELDGAPASLRVADREGNELSVACRFTP